jgi:hypothetical protein
MTDCLSIITDKVKGLTKQQAMDMLTKAENAFDKGIGEQDLLNSIDQILDLRKEKIKTARKLNVLRDFSKRKSFVDQVMTDLDKEKPVKIAGKTIYSPLERRFFDIVRSAEQYRMQLGDHFKQTLEGKIENLGLKEFYHDKGNQVDIIKEIAGLTVRGEMLKVSITGNDKAYKVAKEIVTMNNQILQRKTAAGSTVGFLEGRVSRNSWDPVKIAGMSDDHFYSRVKDIKWGDELATRDKWIELKQKIVAGNYKDLEDALHYDKLDNPSMAGQMASGGNLAEFSGLSRHIMPTTEQYIEIADELFKGQGIAHRIALELGQDGRTVGELEFWGSNPVSQYDTILEQLMVSTRGDKLHSNSQGKSVLDNEFIKGVPGKREGAIKSSLFGSQSIADNVEWANILGFIRNANAVAKLPATILTSQMDVATKAVRMVQLQGKGNVVMEVAKAYRNLIRDVGNDVAKREFAGFQAGLNTMFDDLINTYRYFDPEESGLAGAPGTLVNKGNQVLATIQKTNPIDWWTRSNRMASYVSTMHIYHQVSKTAYEALDPIIKEALVGNGITKQEWDFVRQHGIDKTARGEGILSAKKLNSLPDEVFKQLNPDITSKMGLDNLRNSVVSKWNTLLYRETNTATLMPDAIDQARLLNGTRPGTIQGEWNRFTSQFRSFSYGFAARVVVPLIRHGNAATVTGFIASAITLGMLKYWVGDILSGKTPRDFTKPQNLLGLVALAMGVPFLDDLTGALVAENIDSATISDIALGPVISDLTETGARALNVIKKIGTGEFESEDAKKFAARTFLPTPFIKNYPILGTAYNTLIYNNIMEGLYPGYKSELEEREANKGKQYWVGP